MNHAEAAGRQARQALRQRLIMARESIPDAERKRFSRRIEKGIETLLSRFNPGVIGFCWPVRGEFDARPLISRYLERGGRAALPVMSGPALPMTFRDWRPESEMIEDRLSIRIPACGALVKPQMVLMPLIGFDYAGYRLGYGGGYFDRTLAAAEPRPIAVGVGFEVARLSSVDPQPWDIPCDYVVTEGGTWQRESGRLQPLARD